MQSGFIELVERVNWNEIGEYNVGKSESFTSHHLTNNLNRCL